MTAASDALAMTGAEMPDWYHEEGRAEYERLVRNLEYEAAEFGRITGQPTRIQLDEYTDSERYLLIVWVGPLAVRFHSLEGARGWIDRMYPE